MVDAINAVTAATHSRINQNKELFINWKNLSAKEVLEHAQKGDEVPTEILKWAEDYAKLENVPDYVTYETVNGATSSDDVKAESGAENAESAEETDSNESETEENSEEINLYDQAKILIPESMQSNSDVRSAVSDAGRMVTRGENIASRANERANATEILAYSIKKEYDELVKKMEGDKKNITSEDLQKLDRLSERLTNIGNRAQNEMAAFDIQIQEIEQTFSQYLELPPIAVEKGTETVDVGAKLIATSPENADEIRTAATDNAGHRSAKYALRKVHHDRWGILLNRDYMMGRVAISAGGDAIDRGTNGGPMLERYSSEINDKDAIIQSAMDRIEDITLVERKNFSLNNENKSDNKQDIKKNSDEAKNDTSEKNDSANRDTDIQSDTLALQKRKELRGEIDQA